ncbi:two-component sensor histidine kinase [Streptosporangium nondiastaticum]|uniref:histidine kinase n=1 Tax=Streptosporangium nondiastaticum TaxID=35764 RepID=A0A9X7PG43_9ACTN|nr:histidine kinase [Streptosporangium nondiastaticum]PSJ26709.1 two-component sensor histidine kinase [Streptosporangium nondiastaticum]
MITALRPVTRTVTYTRWLHLVMAAVLAMVFAFVVPGLGNVNSPAGAWLLVVPLPFLAAAAMVPGVRLSEGMQAQLLLFPAGENTPEPDFTPARSASWADRRRTAVWLIVRYEAGVVTAFLSVHVPALVINLIGSASGSDAVRTPLWTPGPGHWSYALLGLLVPVLFLAFVVFAGEALARAARALLGPSAAQRLAALEERTERLLEHNRLARELHDSVGHALTVAVLQAGAARAAGSPEFTDKALAAIEETGRHALEDLDRVLKILREDASGTAAGRPALTDVERLLTAARGSGTEVAAEVSGALEALPGPVSREGYRIAQEALTNVVRHAGPVRVSLRIAVRADVLELDIRNPLPGPAGSAVRGGGSGLRGIRERAALLGGHAETGVHEGAWRVRVVLPLGV